MTRRHAHAACVIALLFPIASFGPPPQNETRTVRARLAEVHRKVFDQERLNDVDLQTFTDADDLLERCEGKP